VSRPLHVLTRCRHFSDGSPGESVQGCRRHQGSRPGSAALGATVSVVSGGIATVIAAAVVAAAAPVVREYVQPHGVPAG